MAELVYIKNSTNIFKIFLIYTELNESKIWHIVLYCLTVIFMLQNKIYAPKLQSLYLRFETFFF